jgi:hypothetical protein
MLCIDDFGYSGNLFKKIINDFIQLQRSFSILKNNIGVVASPKIL